MASHAKDTWVRGSYYVRPLHPTLEFLQWDYGALDQNQERDYIRAKMQMLNQELPNIEVCINWWYRNLGKFLVCKILILKCFCGSWLPTKIKRTKYMYFVADKYFVHLIFGVGLPQENILTPKISQITVIESLGWCLILLRECFYWRESDGKSWTSNGVSVVCPKGCLSTVWFRPDRFGTRKMFSASKFFIHIIVQVSVDKEHKGVLFVHSKIVQ